MIAMTRRICINPPIVNEEIIPRAHKIIRTTAMVHNMLHHSFFFIIIVRQECLPDEKYDA